MSNFRGEKKVKTAEDNQTYKKVRRIGQGCCVRCPPFKGENAPRGRKPKPEKHKIKTEKQSEQSNLLRNKCKLN